ncbi:hypothetical protein LEP1GSC036_0668 [Leptospira weilii str. 2006001853]|uniref:Uncharacterized protein n=1 Tax=Leptospira weilii str. 2006001853 TaxID=1001589 RepID=A0A828Z8U5_9LEPT|nr:hypothetical protein LEP1GSC036_0668 [Leptospira weilii str. 2006001853]EMJ64866.1 hypothetical protein LEP1GSC051_3417 [Leptospira sp. P2653]EMN44741.1 hypothetical protein LEP1GSC086_4174 [Leptospira weilii str. LNT 1234]
MKKNSPLNLHRRNQNRGKQKTISEYKSISFKKCRANTVFRT